MKTLVLYYSYSGTTKKIAEAIADELGADTERISVENEKNREGFGKYFFGGMQAVLKQEPKIKPLSVSPADYDLIIMGTPVWAGTCAPAIRTMLSKYSLSGKQTAFFYTHQGGPGHTKADLLKALEGTECKGSLDLCNAVKNLQDAEQKAKSWSRDLKQD